MLLLPVARRLWLLNSKFKLGGTLLEDKDLRRRGGSPVREVDCLEARMGAIGNFFVCAEEATLRTTGEFDL